MKIIDVSQYQSTINWKRARQEVEMVILRASCGTMKDKKYIDNATKCDIPFGAYHYLKAANEKQASDEAKHFFKCATTQSLKPLFYVCDIEYKTQNSTNVKAISKSFVSTLRNLGAQKIGLYIGQSLYEFVDKSDYDFIWIPRYGKDTGKADLDCQPVYPCDLWQYTSKGQVNGIQGAVDLNMLHGEKELSWFSEGFENRHKLTTTGNVNIRRENSEKSDVITVVPEGTMLDPFLSKSGKAMMSGNGWYPVHIDGGTGWVSGKYVKT